MPTVVAVVRLSRPGRHGRPRRRPEARAGAGTARRRPGLRTAGPACRRGPGPAGPASAAGAVCAFSLAACTAATTRSARVSVSSGSTAFGSMARARSSPEPVTVALTRPPPAWPSTSVAASSSWARGEVLLHLLGLLEKLLHVGLATTRDHGHSGFRRLSTGFRGRSDGVATGVPTVIVTGVAPGVRSSSTNRAYVVDQAPALPRRTLSSERCRFLYLIKAHFWAEIPGYRPPGPPFGGRNGMGILTRIDMHGRAAGRWAARVRGGAHPPLRTVTGSHSESTVGRSHRRKRRRRHRRRSRCTRCRCSRRSRRNRRERPGEPAGDAARRARPRAAARCRVRRSGRGRRGHGGRRRPAVRDLTGRPFPLGDWGEPAERLDELYRWVEDGRAAHRGLVPRRPALEAPRRARPALRHGVAARSRGPCCRCWT